VRPSHGLTAAGLCGSATSSRKASGATPPNDWTLRRFARRIGFGPGHPLRDSTPRIRQTLSTLRSSVANHDNLLKIGSLAGASLSIQVLRALDIEDTPRSSMQP